MVSSMKYELWTILMAWKYVSCEVLSFMLKGLLPYYDKRRRLYCFLDSDSFLTKYSREILQWRCVYG